MVIVKMPGRVKPAFHRYIGIDFSGAETPDSSLKGLRVYEAMARPVPAARAGGGSLRKGPGLSRSFISTCPGQWPSQPMQGFRGCVFCERSLETRFTSGLLMAGMFQPENPVLLKFIPHCGANHSLL